MKYYTILQSMEEETPYQILAIEIFKLAIKDYQKGQRLGIRALTEIQKENYYTARNFLYPRGEEEYILFQYWAYHTTFQSPYIKTLIKKKLQRNTLKIVEKYNNRNNKNLNIEKQSD